MLNSIGEYTTLENAVLLVSPSAAVDVQLNMNLLLDSIFRMTLHSGLSSAKSYSFRMRSLWFTVSNAADRSTNAAPVIMPLC